MIHCYLSISYEVIGHQLFLSELKDIRGREVPFHGRGGAPTSRVNPFMLPLLRRKIEATLILTAKQLTPLTMERHVCMCLVLYDHTFMKMAPKLSCQVVSYKAYLISPDYAFP